MTTRSSCPESQIQLNEWLGGANGLTLIRIPRSDLPVEDLAKSYDTMVSSGERTFANFLLFKGAGPLARNRWNDAAGPPDQIEGKNLPDARAIKAAVNVPVICTGGFQTASVISKAIERGDCDAVSAARPLVANNDLVEIFRSGKDQPDKPCTYCNRCLVNVVENPLGCYEEKRFPSREAMIAQIMSVFDPPPFVEHYERV